MGRLRYATIAASPHTAGIKSARTQQEGQYCGTCAANGIASYRDIRNILFMIDCQELLVLRQADEAVASVILTAVGFEPTPLRTGA